MTDSDVIAVREYLASNHRAWGPHAGYGPNDLEYVQAVAERIAELRAEYKGDDMFVPPTHGIDDLGLCIECDARRIFMNEEPMIDRDTLLKTLRWLQDQPRNRFTTPRYGGTEYDEHGIEQAHSLADKALLEYINDDEITAAYEAIDKWYS